jgi:hypothetical protein
MVGRGGVDVDDTHTQVGVVRLSVAIRAFASSRGAGVGRLVPAGQGDAGDDVVDLVSPAGSAAAGRDGDAAEW